MARKLTFLLKQGEVKKKVFKLFTDKRGDLFISFSYFNSKKYSCGLGKIPKGKNELKFSPVIEGSHSEIPLKLSYHKDGQIHFKPINPHIKKLPLSFKNVEKKGIPFTELHTSHIVTIEVEGLEKYTDFIPTRPSEIYVGFDTPKDANRFKFVFYAGITEEDRKGRFKHCKFISLNRPSPYPPLQIGLYFTPYQEPLGESPSLLCLTGFSENSPTKDKEISFIYLLGS